MSDIWNMAALAADAATHILPVAITTFIGVAIWAVRKYLPQLHYVDLVTKATNDAGVIALAKYMAKRNGGPHINTDSVWEAFVPAARAVSERYRLKID